jgi:hypothetical protein
LPTLATLPFSSAAIVPEMSLITPCPSMSEKKY